MRIFGVVMATVILSMTVPFKVVALEDGTRAVYLEDGSGHRMHVADLNVKNGSYSVDMKSEPFTDQFLSMRPFKCIEGPEKMWCHIPYPYEIARDASVELTDLEYDFLFVWKGAGEYGIDMWNGVYYQLEDTGGAIRGTLHEMNMDVLSVPPDAGEMRPIRETDLEPGEPDSHWLPVMIIE